MRYVQHENDVKPAAEVIDTIPAGSAKNRDTWLTIANEWSNLVAPNRTSSALPSNLAALTETLSELEQFSILRTARSVCEGQTTVLSIEETSPIKTYEAGILVSVAREIAQPHESIQQEENKLIIQCPFGRSRFQEGKIKVTSQLYHSRFRFTTSTPTTTSWI